MHYYTSNDVIASRLSVLKLAVALALAAVLSQPLGVPAGAQPVRNSIDQIVYPAPLGYIVNTGADTENIWWKITFGTTPVFLTHEIFTQQGQRIHLDEWTFQGSNILPGGNIALLPDSASPLYNPENDGGATEAVIDSRHGDELQVQFAHAMLIPASSPPGVYVSRVTFYSRELSGNPDSPALPGPFDLRSEVTFLVKQPMSILKYYDLNGDGQFDQGEPTLSDWEFSVQGPSNAFGPGNSTFTGVTGPLGILALPPLEASGNYTVIETPQSGWINTDPPGGPPAQKVIQVPGGIAPPDFEVRFGSQEIVTETTITISPEPLDLNAPWTLTGQGGASLEDYGYATLSNLPPGGYTLIWGDVDGWARPEPVSQTKTLVAGGSIEFSGTYTQLGLSGDANEDGFINMGDVTRVELIILGLAQTTLGADANSDGQVNMGDVTRIELMILGLS